MTHSTRAWVVAAEKGALVRAILLFEAAVKLDPTCEEGWELLGNR